jgi:hypothetical protein
VPPATAAPSVSVLDRQQTDLTAGADRREGVTGNAVREPAQLNGVVNPDVDGVSNDDARGILIELASLVLIDFGAGRPQQLVDLGILVPRRRLPRSLELTVIHLTDPVLGVYEVAGDPMNPHVRRSVGFSGHGGEICPLVRHDLERDAYLAKVGLQQLRYLQRLVELRLGVNFKRPIDRRAFLLGLCTEFFRRVEIVIVRRQILRRTPEIVRNGPGIADREVLQYPADEKRHS